MNWLEEQIGKELKLNESFKIEINNKTFIVWKNDWGKVRSYLANEGGQDE